MIKTAVIGGGASGLIAAWFGAEKGARVTIFEKQQKLGRKLLATGNGRCNITNRDISISHFHGHNPQFLINVFARFGLDETIGFFENVGIPFAEGERGKLFPASLEASVIPRMFEYELLKKGVDIRLRRKITKIIPGKGKFKIITAGKEEFIFDKVILAAGGCAYPQLGASRSGYDLAVSMGHTIHKPFPAILPITIPLKALHRLEGIKWECGIKVELHERILAETKDEILFTKYGLSGPAALHISRKVNETVLNGSLPEIIIDLFPEYSEQEILEKLDLLCQDPKKELSFCLLGILKNRMPRVILDLMSLDPALRAGEMKKELKIKLAKQLKTLTLSPGDPRSFSDAVVAAGGVDVDEINPATMESKKVSNLHIAGELLDIDGDSGGYNLQFAWSSGALAGMA